MQLLDVAAEPGDLAAELDAEHPVAAVPAVPVHGDLRAARHAALRRRVRLCCSSGSVSSDPSCYLVTGPHPRCAQVQLPGREAVGQLRHVHRGHDDRLPGVQPASLPVCVLHEHNVSRHVCFEYE